jgi:ketosteroid isomerase-like protein
MRRSTFFPISGASRGKAAVAATTRTAHAEFDYLAYQPVFMVTEVEDAAFIVLARLRWRPTDRTIRLFIADFIRFQKGRIFVIREFMDPFDAVQQVLGREIFISQKPH